MRSMLRINSHSDRYRNRLARWTVDALGLAPNALGQLRSFQQRILRQHSHKLFAAQSADEILLSAFRLKNTSQMDERLVTLVMSVRVIHVFEMVDVNNDKRVSACFIFTMRIASFRL